MIPKLVERVWRKACDDVIAGFPDCIQDIAAAITGLALQLRGFVFETGILTYADYSRNFPKLHDFRHPHQTFAKVLLHAPKAVSRVIIAKACF